MRYGFLAGLIVVIVAMAVWFGRGPLPGARVAVGDAAEDLPVDRASAVLPPVATVSLGEPVVIAGSDPLRAPAANPSAGPDFNELRALDEEFAGEPVDESWAAQSESAIANAFTTSELGFSQIQYECRSTRCRVMMTLAEPVTTDAQRRELGVALNRFYREAMLGPDGEGPPEHLRGASGHGLVDEQGSEYAHVSYLYREARIGTF